MPGFSIVVGDEVHDAPPGSLTAAAPPGLPDHVLAHLPRAEAALERVGREAAEARQQVLRRNQGLLATAGGRGTLHQSRVMIIRHVAGEWSEAGPKTACSSGCSHCCNLAVHVPESEALLIAKKTGARLAEPSQSWLAHETAPEFSHGYDNPCVFLAGGRCSIYEHRPFACRRLVNLDAVDLLCQLNPGPPSPVPYVDHRVLDVMFSTVTSKDKLADIRHWFPQGLAGR